MKPLLVYRKAAIKFCNKQGPHVKAQKVRCT